MKYIKLCSFDLKNGLLKNKVLLIASIIIPAFLCSDISRKINMGGDTASFADNFVYVFGGMKEYIPSPTEPFVFPAVWMVLFLALPYATLSYPLNDIQTFGQQVIFRSRQRTAWWLSKCAWNILCCVLYNLIVVGIIILFCVVTKNDINLSINKNLMQAIFDIKDQSLPETNLHLTIVTMLSPVLIAIAVNIFQMTLSLFIKPMFSFLVTATILLSSCYLLSPFFIGNYAMVTRSDTIITNGCNFDIGIFVAVTIILLSAVAGIFRFNRYDIINKEGV